MTEQEARKLIDEALNRYPELSPYAIKIASDLIELGYENINKKKQSELARLLAISVTWWYDFLHEIDKEKIKKICHEIYPLATIKIADQWLER